MRRLIASIYSDTDLVSDGDPILSAVLLTKSRTLHLTCSTRLLTGSIDKILPEVLATFAVCACKLVCRLGVLGF
jgi:hypothetical protein